MRPGRSCFQRPRLPAAVVDHPPSVCTSGAMDEADTLPGGPFRGDPRDCARGSAATAPSPSCRGPSAQGGFRPTRRSPGSRVRSVRACQVLRPRRVTQALAMTLLGMLPSATKTASAPGISFSIAAQWLACTFPADASPTSSRLPAHGSGRCGSLFLHRSGLAPPTPCRSPGAPV